MSEYRALDWQANLCPSTTGFVLNQQVQTISMAARAKLPSSAGIADVGREDETCIDTMFWFGQSGSENCVQTPVRSEGSWRWHIGATHSECLNPVAVFG